jgi:myxalamid-type nonribosomal peptide synthetase MxaA
MRDEQVSGPDTFLHRLYTVATAHPDAVAVDAGTQGRMTYADLYRRSAQLGERLASCGVGPESVVGLHLRKSPAYLISLLGAWFARAAFVPLDPQLPGERLALMVCEAGVRIVISDHENAPLVGEGLGVRGLFLPSPLVGEGLGVRGKDNLPLPPAADPRELAYVIYTSGSTGRPKGVLVTHRGLVNCLAAQIPLFRLGPGSRPLLFLSTSFDASLSDIGTALLSGATLCLPAKESLLPGPELLAVLEEQAITHLDFPPSFLPLMDPDALPPSVETIIIGGEVCPPEVVRRWAERVRLINVYGPTEATICTSLCQCAPHTWREPLLGQVIPNLHYQILDEEMEPVPAGTPGELFIGGVGLARGYLARPELTEQKFPWHRGERLYRTGDRVVQRDDGEIVFQGRMDRQVKVRGLRIEPEEIEANLTQHPGVLQAAVVKRSWGNRPTLVAFVVPINAEDPPSPPRLRTHLAEHLPRWMLPSRFEIIRALPRTITGKVDLDTLSTWDLTHTSSPPDDKANLSREARILAKVWEQVLGVPSVGLDEDFHDLGGDSFALLQVVAALERHDLVVPPTLLAGPCTINALVGWLCAQDPGTPSPGVKPAEFLRQDVERILAEEQPAPLAPAGAWEPPRTILLTGATGFVGSRLLAALLQHTDAHLCCLVRAANEEQGHQRLQAALSQQGLPLAERATGRLTPVPGDLSQPRWGLAPGRWEELADCVDTIYHGAARVHLVLPYEELRASNVLGTREVLRFQRTRRTKRLHYLSTLSVFVATDRNHGLLDESDDLTQTRWVHGGYAQSKWAAEWLLRSAGVSPEAIAYYRLGLITGDSGTGVAGPTDFLTLFLRGLEALGCLPEGEEVDALRVDITPVDYAVAALLHLSWQPPVKGQNTFHIANPCSLPLGELLQALDSFGIPIARVPLPEWGRRRPCVENAPPEMAAALLALCRAFPKEAHSFAHYRSMDLFQTTGVEFGMANTRMGLTASGLRCPPPSRELLHTYFRQVFPHHQERGATTDSTETEKRRELTTDDTDEHG